MKQILIMLRLDGTLIRKDKVALYLLLAPIVMSFLILMILTAVEDQTIHISVTGNIPELIFEKISHYAELELVDDREHLIKRVKQFDNMAGIDWDNNTLQVIFQGNEGAEYEASIRAVTEKSLNTDLPEFCSINVATGRDYLTQVIIAVLLTSPVVIGGIISGFNIVTEKETLMSRAYRIVPLTNGRYLLSRYIVSVIVGLINLVCISFILRVSSKLPIILLATVFALPLFASSPILIGGIAKDKIGSISMIKVLMVIFLVLPIAAAFTPEIYQFFYYPFPMYWHYKTVASALAGDFNILYGVITFFVSGVTLTVLIMTLGRNLQKI